MNYENYYEQNANGQAPKGRGGRVFLAIIAVALVCFVAGVLVAGFVRSSQQPAQLPQQPAPEVSAPVPETPAATALPEATPEPTPAPTERPMPAIDGQLPYLADENNPIPDIVETVQKGVVGIEIYGTVDFGFGKEEEVMTGGSGFVISSEGYIITNSHVVEDASSIKVILWDGKTIDAQIVGRDSKSDVAVLKVEQQGLSVLKLGDSDTIRAGEYVLAIGTPASQNLAGTVTMGIISATERSINVDGQTNNYLQTDAAINFGNSGGPLINMLGEVIGVNTAKTVAVGYDQYGQAINAEGLGFALPINDVYKVAQTLLTKGYVERPAMGIQIVTISGKEAQAYGAPKETAVLIDSVVRGGPADQAGMKPGDIILACDGVEVTEQDALIELVEEKRVGDEVKMKLLRKGRTLEVSLKMGDMNQMDYRDLLYEDAQEEVKES